MDSHSSPVESKMSRRSQKLGGKKWHPELIKAAVRMRGETLTGLALKNGLPECSCRDALRTHRRAAEEVISAFIKVPLEELWPERYAGCAPSTSVDTATPREAHRQNNGAI
jgi:Ner family transcriptional regulator